MRDVGNTESSVLDTRRDAVERSLGKELNEPSELSAGRADDESWRRSDEGGWTNWGAWLKRESAINSSSKTLFWRDAGELSAEIGSTICTPGVEVTERATDGAASRHESLLH